MQLTATSAKSIQISFYCLSNVRSNFEILATARYPDWSYAHRSDIYQPISKSPSGSHLHSWNSWQFPFWISEKWFEGPHQWWQHCWRFLGQLESIIWECEFAHIFFNQFKISEHKTPKKEMVVQKWGILKAFQSLHNRNLSDLWEYWKIRSDSQTQSLTRSIIVID